MEIKTAENVRKISFNQDDLCFAFQLKDQQQKEIVIKAGPKYIIDNFLTSEYPTVGQIEKALNYIEYELTNNHELNNNNEQLVCSNKTLIESITCGDKILFSRSEIETIFDKYIDCATGEPEHILGIKYSLNRLTVLLIVRVIMYYNKFESITIQV